MQVIDAGVATQLLKTGYYQFRTSPASLIVFKGKAAVEVENGKYKTVKGAHQFLLAQGLDGQPLSKEKPQKFDAKANQEPP